MANQDIDEPLACYLSESAEQAALGFIDALEEAYTAATLDFDGC
jgi:toxin ParE1/3/4